MFSCGFHWHLGIVFTLQFMFLTLFIIFYGVPCGLWGVPVTKSDILSSDPKWLKVYIFLIVQWRPSSPLKVLFVGLCPKELIWLSCSIMKMGSKAPNVKTVVVILGIPLMSHGPLFSRAPWGPVAQGLGSFDPSFSMFWLFQGSYFWELKMSFCYFWLHFAVTLNTLGCNKEWYSK